MSRKNVRKYRQIRLGITDAKLAMKLKAQKATRSWQLMFKLRDMKKPDSLYVRAWDRTYKRP